MNTRIAFFALLAAASAQAFAAEGDIPKEIRTSAGEKLAFKAHAVGSQIYICQAGSDGKAQWTLKAPEAELRDEKGAVIGTHYAGPSWKLKDGSEAIGEPAAKVNAPKGDSIPWLLVSVVGHAGTGLLSPITHIQRIHTEGGQAPAASECVTAKIGTEKKSAYQADYYFYALAKK
jgi:hypothetical protein